MLKTLVLEVGVWGCNCTPNVLIEWKSGQNLLKFGQNVCKLPQNRCMLFWINKNGTQNGSADICFGDHVLLFIFSVKLGEIWAKMVLEVGKLLSLFFGVLVLCFSSVFLLSCELLGVSNRQPEGFFGLPTASLGMLSSVYKRRLKCLDLKQIQSFFWRSISLKFFSGRFGGI